MSLRRTRRNASYQGHKSWDYWNVSLWIGNDEGLYRLALECIRQTRTRKAAAECMLDALHESHLYKTPDGARYTVSNIQAGMRGLE